MKERARYRLNSPVTLTRDDKFVCTVSGEEQVQIYEEKIGKKMTIDTIVTFNIVTPVLGLVNGIGAIFGETK